jgi:hypothetical protein
MPPVASDWLFGNARTLPHNDVVGRSFRAGAARGGLIERRPRPTEGTESRVLCLKASHAEGEPV